MRLVTRGDVDGVMCAVLLKAIGLVDKMLLVQPGEMQDGIVAISDNDIVCNLPYAPGCGMWFDHHLSEEAPSRLPGAFRGSYQVAPSAARLVYDYFINEHPALARFEPLLDVVDRFDSANVTPRDLTHPEPAMLLAFLLDPRTGLELQPSYRINDDELIQMIPNLLIELPVQQVLEHPDVRERVEAYRALTNEAKRHCQELLRIAGNVIVLDLREAGWVPPGNRFLIYTIPGTEQTNISIRLSMGRRGKRVVIKVAHNVFNRTSTVNVGALMATYGGGGHFGAGGCHVPAKEADQVLTALIEQLREP